MHNCSPQRAMASVCIALKPRAVSITLYRNVGECTEAQSSVLLAAPVQAGVKLAWQRVNLPVGVPQTADLTDITVMIM